MKASFLVALMASAACGGGQGQPCVPGQSVECACADGGVGAQVCAQDGAGYEPCMCVGPGTETVGTLGTSGHATAGETGPVTTTSSSTRGETSLGTTTADASSTGSTGGTGGGPLGLCENPGAEPGSELWTYDPENGVLWVEPKAIAGDSAGNIVVAGVTAGPDNGSDTWLGKLGCDGELLWTEIRDSPNEDDSDQARGVAVGPQGRIYLAGQVGTVLVDLKGLLAVHEPDGQEVWAQTWPTSVDSVAHAVSVGSSGSAISVGNQATAPSNGDIWIGKYDSTGALLWSFTEAGTYGGHDWAFGVAVAPDESFYVGGAIDLLGQWLSKYDADGNLLWTDQPNGGYIEDVELTPNGDVAVAGWVGANPPSMWVGKYDPEGTLLWQETFTGEKGARGRGVGAGPDGSVAVTGYATVDGVAPMTTRKYDTNGNFQWMGLWGDQAEGEDVTFDSNGYVIAAGDGNLPEQNGRDITVIKYAP